MSIEVGLVYHHIEQQKQIFSCLAPSDIEQPTTNKTPPWLTKIIQNPETSKMLTESILAVLSLNFPQKI